MKCPRCQAENPPGMRFCGQCAATLAAVCSSCGAANPPGNKFCGQCATPLDGPKGPFFASPETYTPKHLAERIINSKAALEGERKQVTVLFADLKGSMELLADRDPEEARKLLDPVLERMMEAVHRYEGTVNQVMGDGIMALFGAPIGHEDHAVRACYAALRMQRRVNHYADEIQQQGGTPVQIRVGLNSGEVVVRAIGSDLHVDYTAVGQTTHLAARMEQMAKPGSVLITGATVNLAEGYVQVRSLGAVPVKGLEAQTPVYELTGTMPARSRLQASAARGLTRFVGRDRELEQLGQALERAGAGLGQVVAVVGEAGVGKSRLAWEFSRSYRTHGWLVLESGSVSYGKATPYLPVIELLKAYCGIQERDDSRGIRERVAGKLLMLDRALEPLMTPLLALLDVPVEGATWAALDPSQRRQRTLEAIKQLLLRESQVQPLLLLFEDLHWIDAETQALLDGLVESLPTARILLLVNYRPEYQHAWGGKTYYLQLRIDPLPPASADTLLTALLGEDPTLAPLKPVLIARTEGNPFFLEESVRTLVETQVLAGERGAYRVTTASGTMQIPATAQAVLAARIDRLAPEDKRLLQAAAVIGKDVPLSLLLAIADTPESDVRAGLPRLQAAEFLYEVRLFPDLEYTFKHALTHEVAYRGLLHERQRALHARITEAIERLFAGRVAEQAEQLAHHAVRGEQWEKAVSYLRQAGLRAMVRGANREAVAYLEQALAALARLPDSRTTAELSIDTRIDLRNALQALGDWARMGDHVSEAGLLARRLGDQHRLARVAIWQVIQCLATGDYDEAAKLGQEAVAIAQTVGDRSTELLAMRVLGQVHATRGELTEAATCLDRIVSLEGDLRYERFGAPGIQSALAGAWLAEALSHLGRFDEAIRHAEAGVHIAEAANHPWSLFSGLFSLGVVHFRRGDFGRATQELERSLQVSRESIVASTPIAAAILSATYALAGRPREALPLAVEAVEEFHRCPVHVRPALILWCAGLSYFAAGRIDEATSHAREALTLSRRLGARVAEANALCLVGDVTSAGHVGDAEAYYHEALALAGALSLRPLIAHCHLGLGKLYRRTDKREQAQEHLTTATTMYREMGMTYWLEKAAAEMSDPSKTSS